MTDKHLAYLRSLPGRPRKGFGKTSRFKGVYRRREHFVAKITFHGHHYYLGSFVHDYEAARAVAAKRAELVALFRVEPGPEGCAS